MKDISGKIALKRIDPYTWEVPPVVLEASAEAFRRFTGSRARDLGLFPHKHGPSSGSRQKGPSPRWRRDRVEGEAARLGADLSHRNGSHRQHHRDCPEYRGNPPCRLDDEKPGDDNRGADPPARMGKAETRSARVSREHLRGENLHRVPGQLDAEEHYKTDDEYHR